MRWSPDKRSEGPCWASYGSLLATFASKAARIPQEAEEFLPRVITTPKLLTLRRDPRGLTGQDRKMGHKFMTHYT